MKRSKTIHLWAPGLETAEGGIQACSAGIAADLRVPESGFRVRVIARNDRRRAERGDLAAGGLPGKCRAAGFAALAVSAALAGPPDLILTTHLHFAPLAAAFRRLAGIPFAVMLHGGEAWRIRGERERRALVRAAALLAVSRYTADKVSEQIKFPTGRICLLTNSADEQRFRPRPRPDGLARRLDLPADAFVVFSLGRLAANHRYKGVDAVIRAVAPLIHEGRNVALVVGGDGDDRPRLEEIARAEKITERVRFAGKIPDEELPAYYNLANAFALPSVGEGFGIVYLEALFSGLPVIAGNRAGAVEAVDGGRLGLLGDPENPAGLTDDLRKILDRTHPHPLLFHPEEIRRQAVAKFGSSFRRQTLQTLLHRILET